MVDSKSLGVLPDMEACQLSKFEGFASQIALIAKTAKLCRASHTTEFDITCIGAGAISYSSVYSTCGRQCPPRKNHNPHLNGDSLLTLDARLGSVYHTTTCLSLVFTNHLSTSFNLTIIGAFSHTKKVFNSVSHFRDSGSISISKS